MKRINNGKIFCDEEASNVLVGWDKMKELGAKVVQVEIRILDE